MALRGRGGGYTRRRRVVEAVLGRAFAGNWPGRLPFAHSSVERVEHTLALPALAGQPPLRIGFVSDVHAGPTTSLRTVEHAFAHLRAFRPHVLLLGGDYVLFDSRHVEQLVPLIASVEAPLGRYAVVGNHDLWADDGHIVDALGRAGATVLVNDLVHLPGRPVSIGGLDDAWTGKPHYARAFEGRAPAHVLLMHSPDHVPNLGAHAFDLAVCGHTHGGHIASPARKPILMTSKVSKRFHAGRFELPGGPLFVSRGIGNPEVPMRAFAPPDVLCFTLLGG